MVFNKKFLLIIPFLLLVISLAFAITSFSVTLNAPDNNLVTTDNTPSVNITIQGTEYDYNCDLYFDAVSYYTTTENWKDYPDILNGIYEQSETIKYTFFNMSSDTYNLISGTSAGTFYGYTWNGTGWTFNTSVVSGLSDVGLHSTPEVFEKGGTFYLVSGAQDGTFYGWNWTGSTWQNDTSIIEGLTDVGTISYPTVFNMSGTLYMISGKNKEVSSTTPTHIGFYWNDGASPQWISASITNGISRSYPVTTNSLLSAGRPTVFEKDNIWYLLSNGNDLSENTYLYSFYYGYSSYWSDNRWILSNDIKSGIDYDTVYRGTIGISSFYFNDDLRLIIDETASTFESYKWGDVFNNTLTTLTTNSSLNDGIYDWNVNCTSNSTTFSSETRSITIDTVAPTIIISELYPSIPVSTNDLTLNVSCSDTTQPNNITAYWITYKNSVAQTSLSGSTALNNGTQTTVQSITSGNVSASDTWISSVWCGDTILNSSITNTTLRSVQPEFIVTLNSHTNNSYSPVARNV